MSRDATRILWLFALAPLIVATVAWGSLAPAFPTKGAEGSGPAAPKRITAAIMGDPTPSTRGSIRIMAFRGSKLSTTCWEPGWPG